MGWSEVVASSGMMSSSKLRVNKSTLLFTFIITLVNSLAIIIGAFVCVCHFRVCFFAFLPGLCMSTFQEN